MGEVVLQACIATVGKMGLGAMSREAFCVAWPRLRRAKVLTEGTIVGVLVPFLFWLAELLNRYVVVSCTIWSFLAMLIFTSLDAVNCVLV